MNQEHELVLGVAPNDRGFGYVVLEGSTRLVDWKVKRTPSRKNQKTLQAIDELLTLFMPTHLVFEARDRSQGLSSVRVDSLLRDMARCAADRGVIPVPVPRQAVLERFEPMEATTNREIALLLTMQFPELSPYLPPKRRIWDSESRAMSIFDATAMVLTFYDHDGG